MLLKVCGATSREEIALVGAAGADLIGLWHGVPGGPADLPFGRFADLAEACRTVEVPAARPAPEPMLVTFLRDPAAIVDAARAAGVRWLQLHGYQPPAVVAAIKRGRPEATVVKVLHVNGDTCAERPLLASYERAGTDLFLFDATSAQGRVGSTGLSLDPDVVIDLAEAVTRPFLLAGGISAANRPRYEKAASHPRFAGIDVDTAARNGTGAFCAESIGGIRHAWRAVPEVEEAV
ncbi:N-(5'-phosphoribosyl)anthranilate isomerase [Streptomyces sp. C11-1]|uniref:N-(5'-phosphoribosyl)anthranilate isomerase n=1 Tax=Streptomyces durocortorensis TaxID=2811104 RepID=A0ABY9VYV6_9ACTN|nr:N-(5'-phosphoribosyl)anthranilate isomerase [Streptomyces durocortorensis]WNF28379.1 N-(5'-phosphoribosyl)anthranilate isomerase [Streptomyces durocortorensis]